MPGGDGTGPLGQGPIGGKGRGMGRRGNRPGLGPGGFCVCPGCGNKIQHTPGVPCATVNCPKCGTSMARA